MGYSADRPPLQDAAADAAEADGLPRRQRGGDVDHRLARKGRAHLGAPVLHRPGVAAAALSHEAPSSSSTCTESGRTAPPSGRSFVPLARSATTNVARRCQWVHPWLLAIC